jgi:hypothetical protein
VDQDFYRRHDAMSDPDARATAFDGLPDDAAGLCAVVQGVLLHDHGGGFLYGEPPAWFAEASRQTRPVEERLGLILDRAPAPLSVAREPFARSVGTCRDYALMLCALLRHRGVPARVRCGFADYFGDGREDHWVCEHWIAGEGRWALADAQLDAEHRAHLRLSFDTADMPRQRFMTAPEAWRACREGADAQGFGHGDDRGWWLLEVNLARDAHALAGRITSAWDSWRRSPPACRVLDQARFERGDRLAAMIRTTRGLAKPAGIGEAGAIPEPPWA